MHKLLIISSYFPPVPGVGGRRWAKFVKYLSRKKDVNVHVISAQNTVEGLSSSFANELEKVDFKHTTLPSKYPKYLEFLEFWKPTLWRKIMFRFQLFFLKRNTEGNYWDFSVNWGPHFKKTIPDIIRKEGITSLIVSGPPYRYTKFALSLKKEFPDLQIIIDYRDPWNDFNDPFPISEERHEFERNLEKEVLESVDKIITVSNFQKSLIQKNVPNHAPLYVVPNGFDADDSFDISKLTKETAEKINLTHFGTLHILKEYYWLPFLEALLKLKQSKPELYKKLEVNFVGYCPQEIEEWINTNDLSVNIHGLIEPDKAFQELAKADIALWFKYDGSPGDFATKFGDYIAFKKFMWTFTVKGEVSEYIEANKIGQVFYRSNQNLKETIYEALLGLEDHNNYKFNPEYDNSKLTIAKLAENLIEVIED